MEQEIVSVAPPPKKKAPRFKMNSCGFINYELSPIVSLAYCPQQSLLVLARDARNTIEIYKYPSFCLLFSYNLNASDLISKIIFHRNDSLLVICQNGMLYEYNFHSLAPTQAMLIPGGSLNDISFNAIKSEYVLASDDGSLKIYEYKEDSSKFSFVKSARNFNSKTLACIWDDSDSNSFYVSYQNGFVRKFDKLLNVTLVINLSTNEKKSVFAWKMLCVAGNLILGCSNGNLNFYETKFGTLVKNMNFHQADILCLCANSKGNAIYASGSDSRIISIENLNDGNNEEKGNDWVITSQERGQSHDVYTLVLINDELLISGGLTTDMCLYKLNRSRFVERMFAQNEKKEKNEKNEQKKENKMELEKKIEIKLRHITGLQNKNLIQTTDSSKNLILYQKPFGLEIWELVSDKKEFRFVIEVKNQEKTIVSSCLSLCGTFLAYSTLYSIILYHIVDFQLEKLMEIEDVSASALKFSSDSNTLYYVSAKSEYYQYDIMERSSNFVITLKNEIFDQIETSLVEDYVALGSKLKNIILIFKDKELHYEIPEIMPCGYTSFKFSIQEEKLFVTYENNKFGVFDLKNKCLDKWSSQNLQKFPSNYVNKLNRIVGIVLHPEDKKKIILYSNFYYILVNLEEKIPKTSRMVHWEEKGKAKTPSNFDIVSRKFPILNMNNYNENEIILFQNSWNQMLKNMPGAINTKKFGN